MKRIAVTGGAGQIAYSILFRIAAGELLGSKEEIELRILEVPQAKEVLGGVVMELEDCAFPLITNIYTSTDPREVFENVDIAILIGAKPRGPGMERKELLKENAKIFITQGQALNEKASKDALIFVVGNPCNTNALIALKNAPNLNPFHFFAMTTLDENRAKAQLAKKANARVGSVKKMAIWGNHSSTQVPDFIHAEIGGKPATQVITDRTWLEGTFIETVQKRGSAVISARGKSSAASAANAAICAIRSLLRPTPSEDWFSCGLFSGGNPYSIQEDLIFSFPCVSKGNGQVEIVSGLKFDAFLQGKILETEKELIAERDGL